MSGERGYGDLNPGESHRVLGNDPHPSEGGRSPSAAFTDYESSEIVRAARGTRDGAVDLGAVVSRAVSGSSRWILDRLAHARPEALLLSSFGGFPVALVLAGLAYWQFPRVTIGVAQHGRVVQEFSQTGSLGVFVALSAGGVLVLVVSVLLACWSLARLLSDALRVNKGGDV